MTIDIERYPVTVEAFGGNAQRGLVFLDRYAMKNSKGVPQEMVPEDMWGRVAIAMTETDEKGIPNAAQYNRFFGILKDFKFVPGGRILAGAGVDALVTFYNCYVIPIETRSRRQTRALVGDKLLHDFAVKDGDHGCDSREAIFDTIGLMVDIMSRGGGVGINWSVLRPSGAYLKTVNGTSSGPVGWMNVASTAVGEVEQGGSRRGAAMFMLDDWHPDLLRFIDAKRDNSVILNANVSVAVSDAFMEAVEQDDVWQFIFPDTSHPDYDRDWDGDIYKWAEKGYDATKVYETVKARDVWKKLTDAAHASGEPGVVFLDRYNKQSTAAGVERLISVNPCGEQGLGPYSVCNLGAMNLDAYVEPVVDSVTLGKPDSRKVEVWGFNYDRFREDVAVAVEFLDRAIDVNFYFLPENEEVQKKLRRIGLSVMGLADALAALGLRYGSQGAVEFTEAVFRTMKDAAIEASLGLAREKGAAPAWSPDMTDRPYIREYLDRQPDRVELEDQIQTVGLRNLFLLTQAPTGTTSILAGVNSGIEPFFNLNYIRKDRTGEHTVQVGALQKYKPDGYALKGEWVTAQDVTVEEHIAMQAAVQKYVDSSVSKTINAPNSQTPEETAKAYELAYRSGLKGLAYYRDGSRDVQVLYHQKVEEEQAFAIVELEERIASLEVELADMADHANRVFDRPDVLTGTTRKVQSKHGSVYVTVNRDGNGDPVEVFFLAGKSGEETMLMAEALGRLASLALRKGATLGGVANQLEGIGGMTNISWSTSLPHAIGQALSAENAQRLTTELSAGAALTFEADEAEDFDDFPAIDVKPMSALLYCPECASRSLVREEGCSKCQSCGYSAC